MKKPLTVLACIVFFVEALFSQNNTIEFSILTPSKPASNSLYKHITMLDSRTDTTLGIIQAGTSNKHSKVILKTPLSLQFNRLMNLLTKNTYAKDSLLINIRHISFNESYSKKETGYFFFRAGIYANKNNHLFFLQAIDTVAEVTKYNVTRDLFDKASKIITYFIESNLLKHVSETKPYTIEDINNLDSIEKAQTTLYNSYVLADGIYNSYQTFKIQKPDYSAAAAIRDGKIVGIKKISNEGKFEHLNPDDVYAIVVNGKPYISIEKEFVPLEKRAHDFYFNATVNVSPNNDATLVSSFLFGIVGGLIAASASEGRRATFEMKIDHVSGKFIKIKEINNKKN